MVISVRAVEAVVFDLDGTLIQSRHDGKEMRRRIEDILVGAGVPASELNMSLRVWEILKNGGSALERMGQHPERVAQTMSRLTEAINEVELGVVESVKPMTHAHEVLEKLRGLGMKIGIATRSCNAYAIKSLELTDLARYVDVLLARDDVEHPKPDPRHLLQVVSALRASVCSAVYVGDSSTDLETAGGAGIVFFGFFRSEERGKRLKRAGCEILVDDLRRIVELVEGGLNL
jgi:HAD superfamily hydrolase (TIGR01509 family)